MGGLSSTTHKMKQIFASFLEDYDSLTQDLNFTVLHQIILGLTNIDLSSQLSLSTSQIDNCCSQGRTPLLWATSRSDIKTMQLLLDFGASVHITDVNNRNVFHIAAKNESPVGLKLLLDTITANIMDAEKKFFVNRLLNETDIYGLSPLDAAIREGRISGVLLLLQYDCDINLPPSTISPLITAIQSNKHELIKPLLARGAKTDTVDNESMGILHIAGGSGDHEILLILLQHEPLVADITLADINGRTPMRCFELDRKMLVQEDEQLYAKSKKVFESLLNKANSYQLQL